MRGSSATRKAAEPLKFEELKSLDLRSCATVAEIVDAMRFCAFGARMLGEAAKTIHEMITAKRKPILIYSGLPDSPLGLCLKKFVANRWCARILLPSQYARRKFGGENVIVVGAFSERSAEAIYAKPDRTIFINPFDMARPGTIITLSFPDDVLTET